jgi:phosphate acetyltransferase
MQADTAVTPDIIADTYAFSDLKAGANVLIFPDLEAGNIGYKLVERLAGARAVGPMLQGLDKPANDLSRGCSAEDVFHVIAVTVVQAQAAAKRARSEFAAAAG